MTTYGWNSGTGTEADPYTAFVPGVYSGYPMDISCKTGDYVCFLQSENYMSNFNAYYGYGLNKSPVPFDGSGLTPTLTNFSHNTDGTMYQILSQQIQSAGVYSGTIHAITGSSTSFDVGTVTLTVVASTPAIPVNVSGTWKDSTPYVNVDNTWKAVSSAYVNVGGGVWQKI